MTTGIPEGWTIEFGDTSVGEAYGPHISHDSCEEADVDVTMIDRHHHGDGANRTVYRTFLLQCTRCRAATAVTDSDWDPTDEAIAEMEREGERLANLMEPGGDGRARRAAIVDAWLPGDDALPDGWQAERDEAERLCREGD